MIIHLRKLSLWPPVVLAAVLSASPARAGFESTSFEGVFVRAGTSGSLGLYDSKVSYDYTNLYTGSLAAPGFRTTSEYTMSNKVSSYLPSISLGYVASRNGLFYGFAISAERPAKSELSSAAFDFPAPTGQPDQPRGYWMTTEFNPSLDLSFSFEPGLQSSSFSLTYLKFSYHHMHTSTSTHSAVTSGVTNPVLTDSSSEDDWTGLGAGLGTRFALTDHFFLDVLVEYVTYLSKRLPASSLTTSDEITITQTQLISPRRIGASAALGLRF